MIKLMSEFISFVNGCDCHLCSSAEAESKLVSEVESQLEVRWPVPYVALHHDCII